MAAVLETKQIPVKKYNFDSITKDKSDDDLAIMKNSEIGILIKEQIKKLQPENIDDVNRKVRDENNDKFYDIYTQIIDYFKEKIMHIMSHDYLV